MKDDLPKRGLLAVSILQGFAYLWLYRRFEQELWPVNNPVASWPLLAALTFFPLLVLLSLTRARWQNCLLLAGGFVTVIAVLAGFAGSQSLPPDDVYRFDHSVPFGLSVWIATFISAPFIQQRLVVGGKIVYADLFRLSWRNFLVPAFAVLFTLITWLLLTLWAALFDILQIKLFSYLFSQDWFLFPALSAVFGVGVITFRDMTRIIDSATELLRGLIKILLPVATFISVIFLLAMVASGTSLVWQTGSGSELMLWLIALTLFGCNAVYQDGEDTQVYPLLLHRFVAAGLFVLPVYVILSGYGLMLRISEYGLTLSRLYGLMVWLFLGLFVAGYCFSVVKKRDNWVEGLGKTNIGMALFIVGLLLVTHSPVLELKRLVIWSQLARLEAGSIPVDQFDVGYLYHDLAQPGRAAVEALKAEYASDAVFMARLNNPRRRGDFWLGDDTGRDFWQSLETRPDNLAIPADLRAFIDSRSADTRDAVPFFDSPFLVSADLDADGRLEYVYLNLSGDRVAESEVYIQTASGDWRAQSMSTIVNWQENSRMFVEHGDIQVVQPDYGDLKIGELTLRVMPGLSGEGLPMEALSTKSTSAGLMQAPVKKP